MYHILEQEMQECPRIIVYKEDIISVHQPKNEVIDFEENMVSGAIKHRTPGIHTWQARIIGKTKQFMHLIDNTGRAWIDANGLQMNFQLHDYVEVEVDVSLDYVIARKMKKVHPII